MVSPNDGSSTRSAMSCRVLLKNDAAARWAGGDFRSVGRRCHGDTVSDTAALCEFFSLVAWLRRRCARLNNAPTNKTSWQHGHSGGANPTALSAMQARLQTGRSDLRGRTVKAERNQVAGGLGFEPRLAESESAVLPLDDPPSARRIAPALDSTKRASLGRGGPRTGRDGFATAASWGSMAEAC